MMSGAYCATFQQIRVRHGLVRRSLLINNRFSTLAKCSHFESEAISSAHFRVNSEILTARLSYVRIGGFHSYAPLCGDDKPSSKLESAVNALKEEKKDISDGKAGPALEDEKKLSKPGELAAPPSVPATALKPSIWERIKKEAAHYYHGFRLLFLNVRVCKKYVKKILRGETLSRRENQQLVRTVSDLFRLLPFSIFIIVPFMELLLPVALWLFPNMLPSTFESQNEKEEKLKKTFRIKLKMAKFLQVTLDEMAAEAKRSSHETSDKAKELVEFFQS
ncbi:unnamed protein product, partial [Notodromas monacha]